MLQLLIMARHGSLPFCMLFLLLLQLLLTLAHLLRSGFRSSAARVPRKGVNEGGSAAPLPHDLQVLKDPCCEFLM